MADPTKTPIEITSAQGVTDAGQAVVAYLFVIFTFITGLIAALGKHDAVALVTYIQANLSGVVAAVFGLAGIVTFVWRIYKTYKRGAQLVTVEQHAPNSVIRLKR